MPKSIPIAVVGLTLALSASAFGQAAGNRPAPAAEFIAGYAGFVDDATIDHAAFGGAARVYVTPRIAVGPEVVYLRGPGSDRDVIATGNLTFDLLRPTQGRPPRVSPFLVGGVGFFRHSEKFSGVDFSSTEGAFTGGGGVRAWFTDRVYGLVDVRVGWELHGRVNGAVGVALGR